MNDFTKLNQQWKRDTRVDRTRQGWRTTAKTCLETLVKLITKDKWKKILEKKFFQILSSN